MNLDNHSYGNAHVLSLYCGLHRVPPIWGYLQHGWTERLLEGGERHSRFWPVLVYTDRQVEVLARENPEVSKAIPIGAPFLYLQRLLQHDASSPEASRRQGLVAYPLHHWARKLTSDHLLEHSLFAQLLLERAQEDDVLVVLHWSDWEASLVRGIYEEVGLAVTTHGNPRADRLFLFKQFHLLSQRASYITNGLGTSLMFAASLGLSVSVVDFTAPDSPRPERRGQRSLDVYLQRNRELFPALYGKGLLAEQALVLGRDELGWNYLRHPDELRTILGWTPVRRARGEVARGVKTVWELARGVPTTSGRRLRAIEASPHGPVLS